MLREAFSRAGAKPQGTRSIDFLDAILRQRPDLRAARVFSGTGPKGHTVVIGDEVFKGPQRAQGECMRDFETECRVLKELEGSGLPIPAITTVGKDFHFFGMTRTPGVVMGSDYGSKMSLDEQRQLAKDLVNFVVGMAHALPVRGGKFAMHDDLYYNNIFIDPATNRLSGVIDFGIVNYTAAGEWKPMYDFKGKPLEKMLEQEFARRRGDLPAAARLTGASLLLSRIKSVMKHA